jgi:hypothetical protein
MPRPGTTKNRGPIPFDNTVSAEEFVPPIGWIHISSVGSGGLVVKDEAGTTRTYTSTHLANGVTIYGPFSEITSTTCTAILAGDGPAPRSVLANVAPAATGGLGSVKMSAAPADGASPIAVGSNDVRVCQVEIPIPLVAADGTFAEASVWIPGVACTITGASLSSSSAITQNDTNYLTFTLGIRDGAGGGASSVASKTTQSTGGASFTAFQAVSLGSVSNASATATSQITFKSVKAASGQAVTNGALLRITYTVP